MGLFGFGKNKKKDDMEKEVIKGENTNLSDKKVSIKVLGEGCEKCDKVNDNVKEAVEILNLDADIEKIEDLIEIVTYGVMSTPGIVINEKDLNKDLEKENINLSGEKVSIKVLGEGCEKCDKVNDNVKEAVEILNLDADIEKIEDLIEIVTYGVMSTPGIVINEKVVSVGKILKTDEIVELLKKNI